jgi:hypothetical protein
VEVKLHSFLTLALDGGEWLASLSSRFTPEERALCIQLIGGWVDPRAGLGVFGEDEIFSLSGIRTPSRVRWTGFI